MNEPIEKNKGAVYGCAGYIKYRGDLSNVKKSTIRTDRKMNGHFLIHK